MLTCLLTACWVSGVKADPAAPNTSPDSAPEISQPETDGHTTPEDGPDGKINFQTRTGTRQSPDKLRRLYTKTAPYPDSETRLLQATLHHSSWVEAHLEEWAKHSGATEQELQIRQKELKKLYLQDDTSFEIWLQTTNLQTSELENWTISLTDSKGVNTYPPTQITSSLLETTVQTHMVEGEPVIIRLFSVLGQVRFTPEARRPGTTIRLHFTPPAAPSETPDTAKQVSFSWKIPK